MNNNFPYTKINKIAIFVYLKWEKIIYKLKMLHSKGTDSNNMLFFILKNRKLKCVFFFRFFFFSPFFLNFSFFFEFFTNGCLFDEISQKGI